MIACLSSIKLMSHNNKGMVEQWDWPNMGCIFCLLCFLVQMDISQFSRYPELQSKVSITLFHQLLSGTCFMPRCAQQCWHCNTATNVIFSIYSN